MANSPSEDYILAGKPRPRIDRLNPHGRASKVGLAAARRVLASLRDGWWPGMIGDAKRSLNVPDDVKVSLGIPSNVRLPQEKAEEKIAKRADSRNAQDEATARATDVQYQQAAQSAALAAIQAQQAPQAQQPGLTPPPPPVGNP